MAEYFLVPAMFLRHPLSAVFETPLPHIIYGLLSKMKYRNGGIWCDPCVVPVRCEGIWFSENAQNTTLDTNSNRNPNPNPAPAPTHMSFRKKKAFVFVEKDGRPHYFSSNKIFPDFHPLS